MARNGRVVIRPDSGDPVDIICGTSSVADSHGTYSPEERGVVSLLWDTFGGTTNEKGYKVLDSHIGTIYGDSITVDRAREIARRLEERGFASTNVVLGVGSYSYQYVTRDTLEQAQKATWVVIDGVEHNIFKDPATDVKKIKKSLTGRVVVLRGPRDIYAVTRGGRGLRGRPTTTHFS
jgi:nicotinamide phosphoribosyltransferase